MDMEVEYEEEGKEKEVRIEEMEKIIEEKVKEALKVEQQPVEQVPKSSPPHSPSTEQVEIHDELEVEVQNQNPLNLEEIKVVMDQEKEQNTLLENVVLVSTEELAKVTIKDKPTESISVKENTVATKGHIDPNKEKTPDTPKDKEEQAMHTLVNLPSAGTPTKSQQEPSTAAVPLQISTPGSSQSKVAKVLNYGDLFLDENIIIPHFESATMTLDDLNKLRYN